MAIPISTNADRPAVRRPWTRLTNPRREELDDVANRLGLHPLVIEDLLAGRQQPKAETFDRVLYLSIWDIDRSDRGATKTDTDLALIVTEEQLILVQRGDTDEFRDLDALLEEPRPLRIDSPLAAAHRVLDAVVGDFIELGAAVEKDLERLEADVFDSRVREDYQHIYRLRQRIGQIDRASTGLADALSSASDHITRLTERQSHLRPYFTHLLNDARGVAQLTSTEHQSLNALVSCHQSNVATRQNKDMRTISAFAALLAIPTVIAGIYGMNFKNLPPFGWEYGWIATSIAIVVIDVAAYALFRRRGWLGTSATDDE
ncbi:CorA family divalent cation transporter [Microbacterium hydrocarbonoxydans]|jgi:magnesium transporter|uniref:CorA family divalent cation transporter n=1 Tax=Microbacterium hydrocarbonoxydans TaxID=273678 RepID=UPI003D95EEEC